MLVARNLGGLPDPFFSDVILILTAAGATVNRSSGSGYWDLAGPYWAHESVKTVDYWPGQLTGRLWYTQTASTPDQRAVSDDQSVQGNDRSFWTDGASGSAASMFELRDAANQRVGLSTLSPRWDFGTGDLTFEAQVQFPTGTGKTASCPILTSWNQDVGGGDLFTWELTYDALNGYREFQFAVVNSSDNQVNIFSQDGQVAVDDAWHHVAVTRSGSTWRCFTDGVLQATETSNPTIQDAQGDHYLQFMAWDDDIGNAVFYVDALRVTKACRYTGNFTPPTTGFYGSDV